MSPRTRLTDPEVPVAVSIYTVQNSSVVLRPGSEADLPRLLAIDNHYVRHGYATFDETEATLTER